MSVYDTIIANGTVITASGHYRADIAIDGEKIVAIGRDLRGARALDATGYYVLPGAVDAHVHLEMRIASGYQSSDDFASGTIAAALGGTTTIVDFVEPSPGQSLLDAIAARQRRAAGRAVVDYGLHMTIPSWHAQRAEVLDQIGSVVQAGLPTFKLYMAYEGLRLDDGELYAAMKRLTAEDGALPIIHCENGLVCDQLRSAALQEGHTEPIYHALTRPPLQEAEAVGRAIDIARLAGSPLYIVHVSCAESLNRILAAQSAGQRVEAETCPQYLVLTRDVLEAPGAARFVCAPPPRSPSDQDQLWSALSTGALQVIATDHCPFTLSEKSERSNFAEIPGGLPSVEARLALVHTLGVRSGRLTLSQWIDRCCTAPARVHGLKSKGHIAPGFDADLVIFDPHREVTLSADALHERVDWTPYEGMELVGWPEVILSRGEVIAEHGEFTSALGRGRFVPRSLPSLR